jgi:hypothetical protein
MLRKLIWLAITSGLAKKLYTTVRARQAMGPRVTATRRYPNER